MKKLMILTVLLLGFACIGAQCPWQKEDREARASTGSSGEVPAVPANLSAAAVSSSQIDLIWEDKSSNETAFRIERKTAITAWAEIDGVDADVTTYSDIELDASTLYYYRIRAANSNGNSGYSNGAQATTQSLPLTAPNAPTGLTANATGVQINLFWTDNSNNEEKFKIERKPDGGVYAEIAQVNANQNSYQDTTVSPATKYWYQVRAWNSVGDSAYTNEATATTPWRTTVVDNPSGIHVGEFTSLGVDSNGKIHISYHGGTTNAGDLKYATNASGSWVVTVIDDSSFGYDVGEDTSLAVDSNNKIHISYLDATNVDLKYATNASGSWTIQTIESIGTVGRWSSIAVDSNNKVHISYYDSTNGDLKYTTNASGSWVISTIDSGGDVGRLSSIAVGSDNKVYVSYYDFTNGDLKYASNASGSWVISIIDSAGNVGGYNSIILTSDNKAHVSYVDIDNGDLKYATNVSGSWIVTTVDTIDVVGTNNSIALDSGGKVHISYEDETNTRLKYATNSSGSWQTFVVDNPVGRRVGVYSSLGIDSANKVHISYLDWTESEYYSLRYATNK